MDRSAANVPPHLLELLNPTPSGFAKLIAAWDGLSVETQIQLLKAKSNSPGPEYLYRAFIMSALSSENGFVRYLAAKELEGKGVATEDDENALLRKIEADKIALVRYAKFERDTHLTDLNLYDPEQFFLLPHEARLAIVRALSRSSAERIADLVEYAIENMVADGKVSQRELYEILSDFLVKADFEDAYAESVVTRDGYSLHLMGAAIEALWNLVPKLAQETAFLLIRSLPERAGLSSGIPKRVLDRMSMPQLNTLFGRSDIGLESLRKETFFKEIENRPLAIPAIQHAFDLTNEEFAGLLARPKDDILAILRQLAVGTSDLRLCLYDAIKDIFNSCRLGESELDTAGWAQQALERKLSRLEGGQRQFELLELRIYRLAAEISPWKETREGSPLPEELSFLKEGVVQGDTWSTFTAFWDIWNHQRPLGTALQNHLPAVWESGEDARVTGASHTSANGENPLTLEFSSVQSNIAKLERTVKRQNVLIGAACTLLLLLIAFAI